MTGPPLLFRSFFWVSYAPRKWDAIVGMHPQLANCSGRDWFELIIIDSLGSGDPVVVGGLREKTLVGLFFRGRKESKERW